MRLLHLLAWGAVGGVGLAAPEGPPRDSRESRDTQLLLDLTINPERRPAQTAGHYLSPGHGSSSPQSHQSPLNPSPTPRSSLLTPSPSVYHGSPHPNTPSPASPSPKATRKLSAKDAALDAAQPYPVIHIGPDSELIPSGAPPALPSNLGQGSDLYYYAGSNEDVYVQLSPKLQTKLEQTYKTSCPDDPDAACQQALLETLQQSTVDLQRRFIPIIIGLGILGGVLVVALGTYLHNHHAIVPARVHLDNFDLAQVSSAAIARPTKIIVADGKTSVTVALPASSVKPTGAAPTVSRLSSPSNGHPAGDYLLTMPEDLATTTQDIVMQLNACHGFSRRSISIPDCIISTAENLMINTAPNAPLNDLLLIHGNFPRLDVGNAAAALRQTIQFAQQLAPVLEISPDVASNLGVMALALVFNVIIDHVTLSAQTYFSGTILAPATITQRPSLTATKSCSRTGALICQSPNCNGNAQKSICSSGTNNGCQCTNIVSIPQLDFYLTEHGNYQASILDSLIANIGRLVKPTPSCFANSDGVDFTGAPVASPATWCVCTQSADPSLAISYSTGIYSTMPSKTGKAACAYTALPTRTISISVQQPGTASPTTCRTITETFFNSAYTRCTCNNNQGYAISTTTLQGSTITYCPDHVPTATGKPYCIGNQVSSNCIAGSLPPSMPYNGSQGPACLYADGPGSTYPRINTAKAAQAAATYCNYLISENIILTAQSTTVKPGIQSNAAEGGASISLTVIFDVDSCPSDHSTSEVNFRQMGLQGCQKNLYGAVAAICAQDSSWPTYNSQYTLEGGVFGMDCALWSIMGLPST